jgi:hypothetical protein
MHAGGAEAERSAGRGSPTAQVRQTPDQLGSVALTPPVLSLPKGGGAIRGIGEKFTADLATGTGTLRVPLAISPGRSGFQPDLTLSYDSGAGNGTFGLGWNVVLPSITRKTDKGLPRYDDIGQSDVFIPLGRFLAGHLKHTVHL